MKKLSIIMALILCMTTCVSAHAEKKAEPTVNEISSGKSSDNNVIVASSKVVVQKNESYALKQFVSKKVSNIKYDRHYVSIKNGKITPKKLGKTNIIFKSKSSSKKYILNIVKKVGFGIKTRVEGDVGKKYQLHFSAKSGVKYSSTNKEIVSVSKKGMITFLKRGTATIKAKYLGKTYKVSVICRPGNNAKLFKPNLENVAVIKIKSTNSQEYTCTKEEANSIIEMITKNTWYYYAELPTEIKEEMKYTVTMYDALSNELLCIELDSKCKRIRVKNDGPYYSPYGFTIPAWLNK